jgi:GNAT superfamily N-acetyltransferase
MHNSVANVVSHALPSASRTNSPAVTLVAQLGPAHRPLIARHLLALPPDDRRLRFGHAISDASIERYVRSLRFARDAAFGAFDDEGRLHGFGHLAFAPGSSPPEFGISVDPSVRRQGIGLKLLMRAGEHARNRGQRLLVMLFVPENKALATLAQRAGMRLVADPYEPSAYLSLNEASAESLLLEAFGEAVAAIDLGFRLGGAAGRTTSA